MMIEEKAVIRLVSPRGLAEPEAQRIAESFARRLNYADYTLKQDQDESLLGGFVVFTGGRRYDYSLKGRLGRIGSQLDESQLGRAEGLDAAEDEDVLSQFKSQLEQQSQEVQQAGLGGGDLDSLLQSREGEPITEEDKDQHIGLVLDDYSRRIQEQGDILDEALVDEVGEVLSVGDGIARVKGLENVKNSELLLFGKGSYGLAMNLEEHEVGVTLLGKTEEVTAGDICRRTGRTISVPGGKGLLGRVVNALAEPIDGLGQLDSEGFWPLEREAASVVDREPVNQPLYTGITAVDAMTPIGRGQRELIIGDRQTGKTAIAIDAILNQKGKGLRCVYVAIGQKLSTLATVVNTLRQAGAMSYTTVVSASASESAAMQYLAPFAGCAIAESWLYGEGKDVLIVYDDLSKHAQAYRAISLLLRRPPGREAYPGDVFYLHSRLLERACRLSPELGGGSITALPIVETQAGDISAYIPTNVISITDGQIYLETDLFFSGQRPAINVGLSVSRVGGAAQTKAMKKVAGSLRIKLAQYKEIASFSQFGSELDEETQRQLEEGQSLNAILVQREHEARSMAQSVILLHLATQGALARIPATELRNFCLSFLEYLDAVHSKWLAALEVQGSFEAEDQQKASELFGYYLPQWEQERLGSGQEGRGAQVGDQPQGEE